MNTQRRNYSINSWLASFVYFVSIAYFFASMFTVLPESLGPSPGRGHGGRHDPPFRDFEPLRPFIFARACAKVVVALSRRP